LGHAPFGIPPGRGNRFPLWAYPGALTPRDLFCFAPGPGLLWPFGTVSCGSAPFWASPRALVQLFPRQGGGSSGDPWDPLGGVLPETRLCDRETRRRVWAPRCPIFPPEARTRETPCTPPPRVCVSPGNPRKRLVSGWRTRALWGPLSRKRRASTRETGGPNNRVCHGAQTKAAPRREHGARARRAPFLPPGTPRGAHFSPARAAKKI